MNRERELDDVITAYVDAGAEAAPERFVWAALGAVERTPQRGAWRVAWEDLTVQLKTAASILGIAAALLILVIAFQFIGEQRVASPGPSESPELLSADDLRGIVVTEANVPDGLTVLRTLRGVEALGASETAPVDSPGFIDAILTDFDRDDDTDNGRYGTFAAVFETVADAERAYDAAIRNHVSPAGWDMDPDRIFPGGEDPDPGLGDESRYYFQDTAYGHPTVHAYLWRVGNVLLHAVDLDGYDAPGLLESIARGMNARAG